MENKTVAERLREAEDSCSLSEITHQECDDFDCDKCIKKAALLLADMIEAEQAELRAENERLCRDFYEPCARMGFTEHAHGIEVVFAAMSRAAQGHECRVDFKALDLLCDKLDCGDAKRRSIAEQIRKAMSGAERPHEVNAGVDVDALLELADHFERLGNQLVPRVEHSELHRWKARIRDAVKNAKPQLPEGIKWPRFEDGELVKFGDEFINNGRVEEVDGLHVYNDEIYLNFAEYKYGEPVKRPEPEVLDADGVPIKVGDTVWNISTGKKYEVLKLPRKGSYQSVMVRGEDGADGFDPDRLTHRKPDTQEAINADAAKRSCQYFGTQKCRECPQGHVDGSDVDYDECCIAQIRDLLERQRKLMGGE